jgi:hypothetical protein
VDLRKDEQVLICELLEMGATDAERLRNALEWDDERLRDTIDLVHERGLADVTRTMARWPQCYLLVRLTASGRVLARELQDRDTERLVVGEAAIVDHIPVFHCQAFAQQKIWEIYFERRDDQAVADDEEFAWRVKAGSSQERFSCRCSLDGELVHVLEAEGRASDSLLLQALLRVFLDRFPVLVSSNADALSLTIDDYDSFADPPGDSSSRVRREIHDLLYVLFQIPALAERLASTGGTTTTFPLEGPTEWPLLQPLMPEAAEVVEFYDEYEQLRRMAAGVSPKHAQDFATASRRAAVYALRALEHLPAPGTEQVDSQVGATQQSEPDERTHHSDTNGGAIDFLEELDAKASAELEADKTVLQTKFDRRARRNKLIVASIAAVIVVVSACVAPHSWTAFVTAGRTLRSAVSLAVVVGLLGYWKRWALSLTLGLSIAAAGLAIAVGTLASSTPASPSPARPEGASASPSPARPGGASASPSPARPGASAITTDAPASTSGLPPLQLDLTEPDLPPLPVNTTLGRGGMAKDLGALAEGTPYQTRGRIQNLPESTTGHAIRCDILTNKWWPQYTTALASDGSFTGMVYLSPMKVPTTIRWKVYKPDPTTGKEGQQVGEFLLKIE